MIYRAGKKEMWRIVFIYTTKIIELSDIFVLLYRPVGQDYVRQLDAQEPFLCITSFQFFIFEHLFTLSHPPVSDPSDLTLVGLTSAIEMFCGSMANSGGWTWYASETWTWSRPVPSLLNKSSSSSVSASLGRVVSHTESFITGTIRQYKNSLA